MNVSLPDSIVKKAIRTVIEKSNAKLDFDTIITTHGSYADLDKKLIIRITDMKEATGIGIQEGKMVEVDKIKEPDTIFSMTKNTFSSIILNKLDHRQAYFIGLVETDGKNWIRDSILLGKIFDEIKTTIGGKQ